MGHARGTQAEMGEDEMVPRGHHKPPQSDERQADSGLVRPEGKGWQIVAYRAYVRNGNGVLHRADIEQRASDGSGRGERSDEGPQGRVSSKGIPNHRHAEDMEMVGPALRGDRTHQGRLDKGP